MEQVATNQKLTIQKHLHELDEYRYYKWYQERTISFGRYTKRLDEDTEYEQKEITHEI
jgi:hypothetical protein